MTTALNQFYLSSNIIDHFNPVNHLILEYWTQVGWISIVLVLIFFEFQYPRIKNRLVTTAYSYGNNLTTFAINSSLLSVFSVTAIFAIAERYATLGIFSANSELTLWEWLALLVVLDFSNYLWHVANHQFSFLWMFHKFHHSDRCMNISTAFRFHIGEILLTTIYKSVLMIVLGVTETVFYVTQFITLGFVMFHHANFSFPGEKRLSRFIIVPFLHRTHHSVRRTHHDANFGSILSLWDRLFGTLKIAASTELGLGRTGAQNAREMLLSGFRTVQNHARDQLTPVSPKLATWGSLPQDSSTSGANSLPPNPVTDYLANNQFVLEFMTDPDDWLKCWQCYNEMCIQWLKLGCCTPAAVTVIRKS